MRVGVPSCFEKGNTLVEHNLSDKEIMVAYDIEEGVQTALTEYAKHTGMTLTRDFVMEALVKVLYQITEGNNGHIKQEQDPEKTINTKRPKATELQTSEVWSQMATKNDDAPVEVTCGSY